MSTKSPYEILGLPTTATGDEIKKAYKTLALRFHPDKNGNSAEANERFKEVSDAYQILGDEQRRRMFDRNGGQGVDPFFSSDFHSNFGRGAFHDPFELFRSFFGDHDPFGGHAAFLHQHATHISSPFNDPFFTSPSRMMGPRMGMMDPFASFPAGPSSFPTGGGYSSSSSQTVIRNGVRETITTVTQNGETTVTKEKYDAAGNLLSSEKTLNGRTITSGGSESNRRLQFN